MTLAPSPYRRLVKLGTSPAQYDGLVREHSLPHNAAAEIVGLALTHGRADEDIVPHSDRSRSCGSRVDGVLDGYAVVCPTTCG